MKFAVIDLGSNSARMTIAERMSDGHFKEIVKRRVMTRLSEGMDHNLKETPMARTIGVLLDFKCEIDEHNAETLALTTAAVRKAGNGPEFCERVKRETGIDFKIISGETEAYLDFQGVLSSISQEKDFLICDIGGGSCELILVKDKKMAEKISLPFGAMSLTDRHLRNKAWEIGVLDARAEVVEFLSSVPFKDLAKKLPIIGLGGSAGELPALFDIDKNASINGYMLEIDKIKEKFDAISVLTTKERMEQYTLEIGRADTICAGMLSIITLAKELSSPYLKVCTANLRDGIFSLLPEFLKNNPWSAENFLNYI